VSDALYLIKISRRANPVANQSGKKDRSVSLSSICPAKCRGFPEASSYILRARPRGSGDPSSDRFKQF